MADISKIKLPNGSTYDLKDASARSSCAALASSKADVSSVSKVFIKDPGEQEYADGKQSDLSVFKLTNAEYAQLVVQSQTQPNAQYIISDEYFDVFGQKIKNVASPTDLSDAANKEYVDSNFQPAGSYLTAVPDAYKTYAATLSSLSSTYSLTSHTHAGYASSTHAHGNMQNGGTLQTTDVAVANGDKLVVTDASNSNKVARTSVAFDGSTTTQFLSKKGTWESAVPTSRTVAGYQLTANVTAANISSAIGLDDYVPTSRKVNGKQLTADVTLKPADISALALSGGTIGGDVTLNGELTASGEFNVQGGIVSPYIAFDADYSNGWSLDGTKLALVKNNYEIVVPNVTASDSFALASQLRYKLATATGTLSSGSYVYDVEDRSVTTIGINQSSTPVIVRLPEAVTGARDFILRIEISSSSAPSFTFTNTAGLDFDSEDDDWAVMEPGLNIVSFTETKR